MMNRWKTRIANTLSCFGREHMRLLCCTLLFVAYGYDVGADIEVATIPNDFAVFEDALYFEIVWPDSLMYTYKLRQAKDFGTNFRQSYERVAMILADPEEACQDLYNNVGGAVVLILRGGCSFLTKTKVAERAGAIAAIIADNDESNDSSMIDMIDDSTQRVVHIPATFLMGKDGLMIRRQLNAVRSDRAIINIPVNLTGKPLRATKRSPWTLW